MLRAPEGLGTHIRRVTLCVAAIDLHRATQVQQQDAPSTIAVQLFQDYLTQSHGITLRPVGRAR